MSGLSAGVAVPIMFGVLASAFFGGIMTTQTYIYFRSWKPKGDGWGIKTLVAVIWTVDALQLCLITQELYWTLVDNFGNEPGLRWVPWSFAAACGAEGFISFLVQCFYTRRLYILSERNWLLAGCVAVPAFCSLAFCMLSVAKVTQNSYVPDFPHLEWAIIAWLVCAIIADIAVVTLICWYLNRGKTGFKKTDLLIDKLLFLTVNTGLLPTIAESCHLITFAILPINNLHIFFNYVVGKLYGNSFLATLNSRQTILESASENQDVHVSYLGKESIHMRLPMPALTSSKLGTFSTEYRF